MTISLKRSFGLIGGALMALASLLALGSPAAAETSSGQADALLAGVIQTNDPGLAVLVAQDGKILFEKGYGLADREQHVPVIPQTTFRIGSITKQFTASAILKLQEEGKLSVEDKLSKYIPDFPRGDEVTLRRLLNHTAGINDDTYKSSAEIHQINPTTTEALIKEIKKRPYDFNPGTEFRYSNSGYVLLAYIVEKVSGQSYGDFLRENFFQPLGMTNSGVYRADLGLPHEALGYSLGTNGFERALNWDMSWAMGCGALYSTVEDLYRWNEGIFNGRVLDAASFKEAFNPVKELEGQINSDSGYGFGWDVRRYRGLREIGHNGGLPGFRSELRRLPDEEFTVAILASVRPGRPNADPDDLARQLMEIFLLDKLAPLPTVNTNVSSKSYDVLTGRYDIIPGAVSTSEGGSTMIISRRGTHLFEQYNEGPEHEIFAMSDTEFTWGRTGIQITFVKDSNGKAIKLIIHNSGFDLVALRVKTPQAE